MKTQIKYTSNFDFLHNNNPNLGAKKLFWACPCPGLSGTIQEANTLRVPSLYILYTRQAGGYSSLHARRLKGLLIISYHYTQDTNILLQNEAIIKGTLYQIELYNLEGQPAQCYRYLTYRYIQRRYTSQIRYPLYTSDYTQADYLYKLNLGTRHYINYYSPYSTLKHLYPFQLEASAKATYTYTNKPKFFKKPPLPLLQLITIPNTTTSAISKSPIAEPISIPPP